MYEYSLLLVQVLACFTKLYLQSISMSVLPLFCFVFLSWSGLTTTVTSLSIAPLNSGKPISRQQFVPIVTTGIAIGFVSSSTPLPAYADVSDEYITTERGLQYIVTKPPNDPNSANPERAQKVKASYTLYLNGFPEDTPSAVKIDSSKGFLGEKPFEFLAGVSQVIKGWDLAIMDMKTGEARKLIINSDLGYGDKGAGGKIPGKATLYFDVELLELGTKSKVGPDQIKWLEEHPL